MCAHRPIQPGDENLAHGSSAGWRELHLALMAGVPHGAEIVMALDASGLRFPAPPSFDGREADLRCYRLVHRAWREGLLFEFLRLLQVWGVDGGSVCPAARGAEFQTALFEFLRENRRAGLPALAEFLNHERQWLAAREGETVSAAIAKRRLDALWAAYSGRRAA